ncbi:hypothetical protein Bca52824_045848 [Brassica carinata]|uniref:Uncharacterized protein n=1 Tax=Brassica carinata TaxID=52824 RepID=A0A8X7UPN8_BRACI|nr:hypothetical protein Bca52824_045848 [Brassica carinata]
MFECGTQVFIPLGAKGIILKEETTEGEGEVVVVEWFDMPDGRMFYACCIGPGTDELSYKFNLYPASGKRLSSESKLERVREVSNELPVPSLISSVLSDPLSVKECGRDVEGTSLSLAMPSSTEPCRDEVGFSSLDGEFAREQLSLMVRKMELADGRKSWSEIAESVIFAEVGTLTGSEAEDRVNASLIEEGTDFLFDEHGTNLVPEPGVGGSRPSLKTPPVVLSSSSLVKKTMLETIREHEQMQLANSFLARESSSETTSSSDGSSYSSFHSEESADAADVANESDNVVGDDGRDDDVENVDVENDGVLGGAGDEQNGTGDVDVDEESEQDEFASDGDHAAVGDDDVGDRDGVDRRSRHLVGVPLAPGDSECVEYFKETKAWDWTVVRRSEVWRRIPFIDSG